MDTMRSKTRGEILHGNSNVEVATLPLSIDPNITVTYGDKRRLIRLDNQNRKINTNRSIDQLTLDPHFVGGGWLCFLALTRAPMKRKTKKCCWTTWMRINPSYCNHIGAIDRLLAHITASIRLLESFGATLSLAHLFCGCWIELGVWERSRLRIPAYNKTLRFDPREQQRNVYESNSFEKTVARSASLLLWPQFVFGISRDPLVPEPKEDSQLDNDHSWTSSDGRGRTTDRLTERRLFSGSDYKYRV